MTIAPRTVCLSALSLLFALTASPAARADDAPVKHALMFFEYGSGPNRLVETDVDGKIVWEYRPPGIAVIFSVLPNGNVLFGHGGNPTGVTEINRKGETVWSWDSHCPQVLGCEREPDGNTLVGEQGPPRAVEVNPKGEIVHVTPLTYHHEGFHLQVRAVHKLKNGHIIATHEGDGAVREYDPDGTVVWEYTGVDNIGDAIRLENGNTLIGGGTTKRLIEVTPDKKIAWEFGPQDAPELNLTWVGSIQILPNGDYLCNNFLRGQEGKGAHAFEVNRDKKVVWTFTDHKQFRSVATVRALLGNDAKPSDEKAADEKK